MCLRLAAWFDFYLICFDLSFWEGELADILIEQKQPNTIQKEKKLNCLTKMLRDLN